MTHNEFLNAFERLSLGEQVRMLRTALGIVEQKLTRLQDGKEPKAEQMPVDDDPLLAMAGCFESPLTDISTRHDHYLGEAIRDTHA